MKCPRCLVPLVAGSAGTLTAHGCPRCAGVWLDKYALASVVEGLREETVAAFRAHSSRAKVVADQAPAELPCPVCSGTLTRQRIQFAWLDVDVCSDHGTWFDRGEIERISEALERPDTADWRTQPDAAPAPSPNVSADASYERVRDMLESMKAVQRASMNRMEASLYSDDDW